MEDLKKIIAKCPEIINQTSKKISKSIEYYTSSENFFFEDDNFNKKVIMEKLNGNQISKKFESLKFIWAYSIKNFEIDEYLTKIISVSTENDIEIKFFSYILIKQIITYKGFRTNDYGEILLAVNPILKNCMNLNNIIKIISFQMLPYLIIKDLQDMIIRTLLKGLKDKNIYIIRSGLLSFFKLIDNPKILKFIQENYYEELLIMLFKLLDRDDKFEITGLSLILFDRIKKNQEDLYLIKEFYPIIIERLKYFNHNEVNYIYNLMIKFVYKYIEINSDEFNLFKKESIFLLDFCSNESLFLSIWRFFSLFKLEKELSYLIIKGILKLNYLNKDFKLLYLIYFNQILCNFNNVIILKESILNKLLLFNYEDYDIKIKKIELLEKLSNNTNYVFIVNKLINYITYTKNGLELRNNCILIINKILNKVNNIDSVLINKIKNLNIVNYDKKIIESFSLIYLTIIENYIKNKKNIEEINIILNKIILTFNEIKKENILIQILDKIKNFDQLKDVIIIKLINQLEKDLENKSDYLNIKIFELLLFILNCGTEDNDLITENFRLIKLIFNLKGGIIFNKYINLLKNKFKIDDLDDSKINEIKEIINKNNIFKKREINDIKNIENNSENNQSINKYNFDNIFINNNINYEEINKLNYDLDLVTNLKLKEDGSSKSKNSNIIEKDDINESMDNSIEKQEIKKNEENKKLNDYLNNFFEE